MSLLTINNGTFDNDGSAEKVRTAFDKVNTMFSELYTKIPLDLPLGVEGFIIKVKSDRTGFELVALGGGGDLLASNNLSDLLDNAQARNNLGLGTAATQDLTAFATAAQGAKADSALQGLQAGTGITVNVTDPQNPVITNTETNDYVTSGVIDYPNGRIVLTLLSSGTVNVNIPGIKPVIDGFTVDKGLGNSNYTSIEVGDYASGWDGNRFVAFKVDSLPYTTEANRSYAIDNSI